MRKALCQVIDRLALYRLHRQKSKSFHFRIDESGSPTLSLNFDQFYPEPEVPDITYRTQLASGWANHGTFHYQSQLLIGCSINDQCSGEFVFPHQADNEYQYIFVHGWRMKDFTRIKHIFDGKMKQLNGNLYFFTLPYHMKREPAHSLYSGELFISADINRTLHAVRQAVSDLRALIAYIKHRHSKVVLIGLSLGGQIVNLTATAEEKIDRLISLFYANDLARSVWETIPGQYIKADLVANGFSYEHLQSHWSKIHPGRFQPKIPLEHILLVSGKYDLFVSSRDSDLLWEAWGRPHRIEYPAGHSGIVLNKKQIAEDVSKFLTSTKNNTF